MGQEMEMDSHGGCEACLLIIAPLVTGSQADPSQGQRHERGVRSKKTYIDHNVVLIERSALKVLSGVQLMCIKRTFAV